MKGKVIDMGIKSKQRIEINAANEEGALASELAQKIYEIISEYESRMTVASVVGALDIIKWVLISDAKDQG